jgi:hypothetical protein
VTLLKFNPLLKRLIANMVQSVKENNARSGFPMLLNDGMRLWIT